MPRAYRLPAGLLAWASYRLPGGAEGARLLLTDRFELVADVDRSRLGPRADGTTHPDQMRAAWWALCWCSEHGCHLTLDQSFDLLFGET